MIDHFFSHPEVLKRLHLGPLGSHIDSFAQFLRVQGYQRNTAKYKITIVADLSRWLEQKGLGVKDWSYFGHGIAWSERGNQWGRTDARTRTNFGDTGQFYTRGDGLH